jgi:hypothetical protein
MKRTWVALCAATLAVVASGCVAVSAKNNRWANDLDAVAVGDQLFIVNVRTGQVARADTERLTPIGMLTVRGRGSGLLLLAIGGSPWPPGCAEAGFQLLQLWRTEPTLSAGFRRG